MQCLLQNLNIYKGKLENKKQIKLFYSGLLQFSATLWQTQTFRIAVGLQCNLRLFSLKNEHFQTKCTQKIDTGGLVLAKLSLPAQKYDFN